jgi:hypothetical protein
MAVLRALHLSHYDAPPGHLAIDPGDHVVSLLAERVVAIRGRSDGQDSRVGCHVYVDGAEAPFPVTETPSQVTSKLTSALA